MTSGPHSGYLLYHSISSTRSPLSSKQILTLVENRCDTAGQKYLCDTNPPHDTIKAAG